nr:hypothetical protein [Candidatus Gracilibacteria bacterium]
MDTTTLMIYVITGAFGAGYFVYGKNQSAFSFLLSGIALCIYPYFVQNIALLLVIGIVLIILPFFIKF